MLSGLVKISSHRVSLDFKLRRPGYIECIFCPFPGFRPPDPIGIDTPPVTLLCIPFVLFHQLSYCNSLLPCILFDLHATSDRCPFHHLPSVQTPFSRPCCVGSFLCLLSFYWRGRTGLARTSDLQASLLLLLSGFARFPLLILSIPFFFCLPPGFWWPADRFLQSSILELS